MSRLLEAIDSVGTAADNLTRACAREGAIVDASNPNPFTNAFRQTWRMSFLAPNDMVAALGKLK